MKPVIFAILCLLVVFSLNGPFSFAGENQEPERVKAKIKAAEKRIPKEAGVSGLIFFKTKKLKELKEFYMNRVGATLWMDQGDCQIFRKGNFLFGFCRRDKADLDALMTFFFDKKEKVDLIYRELKGIALSPPVMNKNYPIYNFFARDPEGRMIEFQYFTGDIDWTF